VLSCVIILQSTHVHYCRRPQRFEGDDSCSTDESPMGKRLKSQPLVTTIYKSQKFMSSDSQASSAAEPNDCKSDLNDTKHDFCHDSHQSKASVDSDVESVSAGKSDLAF